MRVDFSGWPVLCGCLTFILFVCVDVFPGLIDLVRLGHTYFAAGRKKDTTTTTNVLLLLTMYIRLLGTVLTY